MDEMKTIVSQVIEDISFRKPKAQEQIQETWENSIEEKEKKHTRLAGFYGGKLRVYVDSPASFFYMNLKKREVLKNLQKEIPEIKDICFAIRKIT